ncbi:MAG: alanine-phosphoribitol ligase [Chloroflexi bacterium]|nr:alanine-phosphoribitol ligase [Chloroflexota bacterium]
MRYTHVIVGAGAAGCVVANRLSQDPGNNVALLEAGPPDSNPLIHIPAGVTRLAAPEFDWGFSSAPQPQLNDRRLWYPQGRTLGGSTSVNAMIYVRGQPRDYDLWQSLGNPGWGYADVLPWFRRSERHARLSDGYHGTEGELGVARQTTYNPLTRAFVEAGQELGLAQNEDVNGSVQDGVTLYDQTRRNGRRESAATAFLHPVDRRENLTVHTRALATRILVEGGCAVGVEYRQLGRRKTINAECEVIVSGGTINSPRLLLLSGIGPADELSDLGIEVVHDLPGVGKNFQDHMDVFIAAETRPVSYSRRNRVHNRLRHMLRYKLFGTGPMAAAIAEAGAFVRSNDSVAGPDIQIHCLPSFVVVKDGPMLLDGHGMSLFILNTRPRSRGSLTLNSPDPDDPPRIDPNFCSDPQGHDLRIAVEGIKWGRRFLATRALSGLVREERVPGAAVADDDQIREYIRGWAKTGHHPVGSCAMGNGEMAVVDNQLRIRGLDRLRVIDASVMPRLVSGNTQAPTYMIGERGAAIIQAGKLV